MRAIAGVLAGALALAGCDSAPASLHRSVKVELDPHARTLAVTGPIDPWPYDIKAVGPQSPSKWHGAALTANDGSMRVEIRCTEASGESVKVQVTFLAPFDPDLASLNFLHLSKVDRIADGDGKPYKEWTRKGETFELRAPQHPGQVTFQAWPHTH